MPDNFNWTKHVEQRSLERGIGSNEVWSTLRLPDQTEKSRDGSYKFYKNFSDRLICIVAKPQGSQWLILTTYTKEKHSGAYKKYSSSSGYQQPLIQKAVFSLVVAFGRFINRLLTKA